MRYNKILLINPRYRNSIYTTADRPPTGLGYIAEALKLSNIEYHVFDMGLGYSIKDLKNKIKSIKPDLIGISMMTFGAQSAYKTIETIKNDFDVDIVAGGPHISTMRDEALNASKCIDYGINLEGEKTLVELIQGKNLDSIEGLMYRKNGTIFSNKDRPFVNTLDNVHFPTYTGFELKKYRVKEIPIVSSRGCPYNCIFCTIHAVMGQKYRFRSAENILEELSYWYQRGYRRFDFIDDNFTLIKKRVYEICDGIDRLNFKNLDLHCGNGIRADRADRDLLKMMKSVGFSYIAFGVEGGNDKVLKCLKKSEKFSLIEDAIKNACELDFNVVLFFLVGSPCETWDDIQDSIKFANKYPVSDFRFYNITPYPKSEIFDWIKANNYFVVSPSEYLGKSATWDMRPLFITPELSFEDRKKALKCTRHAMKKKRKSQMIKRYKKIGPFGKIIAYIYYDDTFQRMLMSSDSLVRSVEIFRKYILKENSTL